MGREEVLLFAAVVLAAFMLGLVVGAVLWAPPSAWELPAGDPPQVGDQDGSGCFYESWAQFEHDWAVVRDVASWPLAVQVFAACTAVTAIAVLVAYTLEASVRWVMATMTVWAAVATTCAVWGDDIAVLLAWLQAGRPVPGGDLGLDVALTLATWCTCAVALAGQAFFGLQGRARRRREHERERERHQQWREAEHRRILEQREEAERRYRERVREHARGQREAVVEGALLGVVAAVRVFVGLILPRHLLDIGGYLLEV